MEVCKILCMSLGTRSMAELDVGIFLGCLDHVVLMSE